MKFLPTTKAVLKYIWRKSGALQGAGKPLRLIRAELPQGQTPR